MLGEKITVYCPKCKRKVMDIYAKQQIPSIGQCKNCNKHVRALPGKETVIVNKPQRTTASGCTFYG